MCQDAFSLDKFLQFICSFERDQLGVLLNTRSMTVGLAESKRFLMIEELGHWHTSRRSFTLLQAITVCGSTSCWGCFLFLALRDVVTSALHKVYTITKDRPIIKVMILELARRPSSADL